MTGRGLVLLAALGGFGTAACSDPTIPSRSNAYSFADTVIIGIDTTVGVFHWPANRLPVRFYADTRSNMAFLVGRAVRIWEAQFLYGEFRGTLVSDSTNADVFVCWGDCEAGAPDSVPIDVPPDTTPPNSCTGMTDFDFDTTGFGMRSPIRVSLRLLSGAPASPERLQGCMRRMAIHEIGHALGLLRHSSFPDDIMFGSPDSTNIPSEFDRRSIELLYHTPPTIAPPPR